MILTECARGVGELNRGRCLSKEIWQWEEEHEALVLVLYGPLQERESMKKESKLHVCKPFPLNSLVVCR